MLSQNSVHKSKLCKAWVLKSLGPEGKDLSFQIFDSVKYSGTSYSLYVFNLDGSLTIADHFSKEDALKFRSAKPCGRGDPYTVNSKWELKESYLYVNIKTGYRATDRGYKTLTKYKVVELTDQVVQLKEINSSRKELKTLGK